MFTNPQQGMRTALASGNFVLIDGESDFSPDKPDKQVDASDDNNNGVDLERLLSHSTLQSFQQEPTENESNSSPEQEERVDASEDGGHGVDSDHPFDRSTLPSTQQQPLDDGSDLWFKYNDSNTGIAELEVDIGLGQTSAAWGYGNFGDDSEVVKAGSEVEWDVKL